MTAFLRTHALFGIVLASTLLLGACGKREPASPNQTPAPTSTAPTAATASSVTRPIPAVAKADTVAIATAASASVTPATLPPAAATSAPAAPAALSVTRLTLGNSVGSNLEVTDASNSFANDSKTIYASVDTQGSSRGATLTARWSYLEGNGQLISNIAQSIATDGPAVTTFKVENPNLWPDGKYQVEITLDGKPVTTQAFLIRKR
ncbi:MAG: hypothetical protein WC617_06470 [Rhodanobacter sp.]|jgi:hypothetical protein